MKTIREINEKIKQGKAVVVNAEEIIDIVEQKGIKRSAEEVDVVTTGTFAPMCSSGVFLNLKQPKPKIKIQRVWLNNIEAYAGLAAADFYLGATQLPEEDPLNKVHPGRFVYGGGHLIEDLVAGKEVELRAIAYGTDCYPRRELRQKVRLKRDFNDAILLNPRNCYQNYNAAVNLSSKIIYTYMGMLKPNLGNITYCSAGQLSPLLNDPFCRTIGLGTRIFLGGGIGYVLGKGTQSRAEVRRRKGVPVVPGLTLSVKGDLKQMDRYWLRGLSFLGYGASLMVGIGIPIPIIDEEMLRYTTIRDRDIYVQVIDYSRDYPYGEEKVLAEVNYQQLKSGKVRLGGKEIPAVPLSSYFRAKEIAEILKKWISQGKFFLTEAVETGV
ncbi:MAG: hypothetical protein DRP75_03755 [Candidatus Omnitrophota bacterium]|nr:MAG: hypothetical protein DRP75_03755 [Candidatus Omnitrophota bacterium]